MGEIILYIASSLDGFIAREDGSVDWLGYFDDDETEEDYGYQELFGKVDIVLIGRRTYEQILGFGEWPYEGKRCVVFTHEPLAYSDERVEFVSEPPAFLRSASEDKSALTWLVGGADLATHLLNKGLIDEIILTILPIVLGNGIPLFKEIHEDVKLKLMETKNFSNGFVQLHYEVLKDEGTD